MKNFSEEFYYGNIEPQEKSIKQNKAVQKQMKILITNEDFPAIVLSDENRKCARKYLFYFLSKVSLIWSLIGSKDLSLISSSIL